MLDRPNPAPPAGLSAASRIAASPRSGDRSQLVARWKPARRSWKTPPGAPFCHPRWSRWPMAPEPA